MKQKRYRLLRVHGDLLTLRAAVGGGGEVVPITLLVDTGAAYTILRPEILRKAGCDLEQPLQIVPILTVGGRISAPVVTVPWFHCLGQRISSWPVVACMLPSGIREFAAGLLGMDFLARFQAVIDIGRAEIWLEESSRM